MGGLGVVLVILIIFLLIIAWVIKIYNSLIGLRENVRNSKGQIAAQIESRWDALKSLIDATKKYSQHEADVIGNVTEKRASIGKSSTVKEIENDERAFDSAIGRLIAVAEAYPDLKASEVYKTTMTQIDNYENNVRHSRMIFNDTVTKYNRNIQQFPNSFIAGIFNFEQEEYFEHTSEKVEMPSWD